MLPNALLRAIRPLALLAAGTSVVATAAADPQTDVVTPTAWYWHANVSLQTIQDRIADGNRLVDIEVESHAPLRFSAAFVRNQGDHAKAWWWYHGQTFADVQTRMNQHGARLIDLEPYETPNGIRYAIVLVPNAGSDFTSEHGYQAGFSYTQLSNWIANSSSRRIIDIQPYRDGGNLRYAFAWVRNSGNTQSSWWILANVDFDAVRDVLDNNGARLIDLEPHDDTGRFTALMVPQDGNASLRFFNMQAGDVDFLAQQYASRITDLERYRTSGGAIRYAMLLRRNDNDLAVSTALAMRAGLSFDASSGFLLREYQGAPGTVAGVYEDRVFEPASLMKTVHLFTAARQVALGLDSWTANVIENTGMIGSCPTGGAPVLRPLQDLAFDMMNVSSNSATEAIRARYGTALIEGVANLFGAENVELNHTIGCFCSGNRNEITLRDLADLHGAVIDGALLAERDEFYGLMQNGTGFGMGGLSTTAVLDDELNASSLTATQEDTFRSMMLFAHKGGSYGCNGGANEGSYRSRGAYVRLPFRSGCDVELREFFIGAWVNEADTGNAAETAVGEGITRLFRHVVRDAVESWEGAVCSPWIAYGDVTPNSTGNIATCWASGSPYVLDNDFSVNSRLLPRNTFGMLLVGTRSAFWPNPGGSAGNLCIGGNLGRFLDSIESSGVTGTLVHDVDLTLIPGANSTYSVQSGDRLYFQWWHRDTDAAGPTSNFSKALEATFI